MTRGTLRIYLGAAPGAGKTYAMLTEGIRRLTRGTDVVLAVAHSHGRLPIEELAGRLPTLDAPAGTLDVAAVLARRPAVALVDELARPNAAGSTHAHRWQDVEELLAGGIDVVSTVNIDELASLAGVVERITGVRPARSMPETVARGADEVQFVDETPEALRRRMAHGNIYPAERIDAALADYFRPGNLAALRELALLWVADRVEEGLQRYRSAHRIAEPWQTRQRITVGVSGSRHGAALIRRAARLCGGSGAELLAVHVSTAHGGGADSAELAAQRALTTSLGGSYHVVRGADPARALIDFARAVNASQLVLGASRRSWHPDRLPGIAARTVRMSGSISVHLMNQEPEDGPQDHPGPQRSARLGWPSWQRAGLGVGVAVTLLSLATLVLTATRQQLNPLSAVLVYLLVTVLVAWLTGVVLAVGTALAATLLLNYFFTPPLHRFTVSATNNVLALAVFVLVSVLVAALLDRAERRRRQAVRASSEAQLLATIAGSALGGESALAELLEQVREIFGMRAVTLLEREAGNWQVAATIGDAAPVRPEQAEVVVAADDRVTLLLSGAVPAADDQRVLRAVAIQAAAVLRTERLAAEAERSRPLREVDRTRTALLAAVSHDLRTPLAGAKAAVSSLRDPSVAFTAADRAELLATADESLDRLAKLVANLLDMSRLQAGAMAVHRQVVALEDVVARALDSVGRDADGVSVRVPVELPAVLADAGLLERVIGNLLENALRVSPPERPPLITASAHHGRVEVRIVDYGPGLPAGARQRVFLPFQRLGDTSNTTGVGLGLALARGLTEAMDGSVTPEETPGGGLTMVLALAPAADWHPDGQVA
jgi:two-component system, OmpR family, sensor histidine kinase KdpD